MNITVLLNRYDSREGGAAALSFIVVAFFCTFCCKNSGVDCGVDISLTITHCGLSAPACGGSLLLVDFSTCLFPMNKSDSYNITLFSWIERSLAVVVVVSCVAHHHQRAWNIRKENKRFIKWNSGIRCAALTSKLSLEACVLHIHKEPSWRGKPCNSSACMKHNGFLAVSKKKAALITHLF